MGNEEKNTPIHRKVISALIDEENGNKSKDDKEQHYSRRSSAKIRSFHLNKEQYHGQTFGGMKEGYGVYYYENGDKYDGNWKNDKKEGKGYYFYNQTGEVYKGNFNNDLPNGMGIYYEKNGDRYEGMFKDGKKHGSGTIIFKNGGKFKGEFKNGLKHGKGEYKNQFEQTKYEYWENGVLKTNENENILINENESNNLFNETNTKRFDEFLKNTYRRKSIDKTPLLNKIKNIKEKTKNKLNDQQLVQILNTVKEKPNIKNWSVDDVKMLFEKINLEKYIPNIETNSVDGKKLLFLNNSSISNIFKLTDKNEIKIFTTLIEFIGDISNNEQDKYNFDNNIDVNLNNNINNSNNIKSNNIVKSNNINTIINNKISKDIIKPKKKIINQIIQKNNKSIEKEKMKKKVSNFSPSKNKNKNEILIKEMNKAGKSEFYSSLNNNSLNFFINNDEIKKVKGISEGGMGKIILGEWQGKQVVLKTIKYDYTQGMNTILLKKFINEINIIASLRHPNILLYMGTTIDEDIYYMITEYLPIGSLSDYLHKNKRKLTDKQKISIALQIAIAIQYIHSRKIFHCDLKSSNVLLDKNYKIKLSDFGLSFLMTEVQKELAGTYFWMAPEILNDQKYEISSDIYSYGMILWELLTEKNPYYYDFPNQKIVNKKIMNEYLKKRYENNKEIVPIPENGNIVLRYITSKCLKYRPEDRLSLDVIIKYLSKANKCYQEVDEVILEMYNFVS